MEPPTYRLTQRTSLGLRDMITTKGRPDTLSLHRGKTPYVIRVGS
jgi:hypothetical protein